MTSVQWPNSSNRIAAFSQKKLFGFIITQSATTGRDYAT